jgi:hypothetical protein
MVKPSVLPDVKLHMHVGPRITWLHRIIYGERRGQRGPRAPPFGLWRPMTSVA